MLGGRAAEEVVYGKDNVTTGASSDYAHVYATARQMVTVRVSVSVITTT